MAFFDKGDIQTGFWVGLGVALAFFVLGFFWRLVARARQQARNA
jgi:hypothetical protein